MPVRRVILARRAVHDLESIFDYISGETSDETASDVITEILDATERLAEMPGMGHRRPELSRELRVWRVFRFLIIYRSDNRSLRVVRVVHGHRDLRGLSGK